NKNLAGVQEGGALFLVTVRPEGERLWLVAVLDSPRFTGEAYVSSHNTMPITDITALVPQLRFERGKSIQAKPGTLGMSLQTPRTLTDSDIALLRNTKETQPDEARPVDEQNKPATLAFRRARSYDVTASWNADAVEIDLSVDHDVSRLRELL